MNRKDLSLLGLKWNPFTSDIPLEAIHVTPKLTHFTWRVEQMSTSGGFARILGAPGDGKSVSLRYLAHHLTQSPDILAGVLTKPQGSLSDFYRELGDIFRVRLSPSNRWGGFQALRERWVAHFETSLHRPVLLVDEAQLIHSKVLEELRLLSSLEFDSRTALTVVLAGDRRLEERCRQPDLIPLASRIRVTYEPGPGSSEELETFLDHLLESAGNPGLMTRELKTALVDHAHGNLRLLTNLAGEILVLGVQKEVAKLDERLFFEFLNLPEAPGKKSSKKGTR
jgi:type II secretory pathway predicted ATPase ExeA